MDESELIKRDGTISLLKKTLEQERLAMQGQIHALQEQLTEMKSSFSALEEEQEDLLVCLADQDIKMKGYKQRLRELGQYVTDDEEEEDQ